jgi:4-hydroxy-tetrahydrodipicolinate synthase
VTPFKGDQSIDYDTYARILEFHLRHGADALALPMPEGEDLSLTDAEQRDLLVFAIDRVQGRVPVIAHVSDAGTALAVERAVQAERLGAAAIVSHPPYFWHPKPAMVVDHLKQIGSAIGLPFFVCNPPVETAGTSLTTEMTLELLDHLPNFQGVVDGSLDWVYMAEVIANGRKIRPDFQLLAGAEFMVQAFVLGGNGAFSSLSGIAPRLVRSLYDLCAEERYLEARSGQEEVAALHHAVKEAGASRLKDGLAGLKGAMGCMGRPCGIPRPPVKPLEEGASERLMQAITALELDKREPKGW